ncbi:MAG: hypothetical protein ACTSY1_05940 [Alphaproteobacteria bacterium]
MPVTSPNIKKLISYLSEFSPDVAVFLVREIEQHRNNGKDDPIYDLVVEAAREVVRKGGLKVPRNVTALRLFCMPFEDMLVNKAYDGIQRGRIPRGAIQPVWKWLTSGHGPDDLSDVINGLDEKIRKGELKNSGALMDEMFLRAAKAISDGIKAVSSSERAQRRLAGQFGGQDYLQSALQISAVFALNPHLRQLRAALPKSIATLGGPHAEIIAKSLKNCIAKSHGQPEFAIATLISHLEVPSQVLEFAIRQSGCRSANELAQSAYSAVGDLVLYDIGVFANEIASGIHSRRSVGAVMYWLTRLHDYAFCLTSDLDLDLQSNWGKKLVTARRKVSALLEEEIRKAPAVLISVFRQCQLPHGPDGCPPPEVNELFEAERSMVLLAGCASFRDQFSLNEVIASTDGPVRQYLRTISDTILVDIRAASGQGRANAVKWMEVATRFIRIVIGDEEAEQLAHAAQVAAKAA